MKIESIISTVFEMANIALTVMGVVAMFVFAIVFAVFGPKRQDEDRRGPQPTEGEAT
jgi:hypothetical protein